MRRIALLLAIIISITFLAGCANTFHGAKEVLRGICQDTKTNWQKIRQADEWFKKKYW